MKAGAEILTIRDAVAVMAGTEPEKTFLVSPETGAEITFLQLQQESIQWAARLARAGLTKGDKIALLMDNGLVTVRLFLGAMYGGFVVVPLNVRAGVMQLSYMLDHCDARIVFAEEQYSALLAEALEGARHEIQVVPTSVDGGIPEFASGPAYPSADFPPPELNTDDVALLMYSSGSTGKPKAAIHTHASILAHGRNSIQSHELTAADRSLLVLPLYHINAECVTLIPALLSGGSVVVAHRFVVSKFWDWVDDLRITWSALVPTIISELVNWDDSGKDRTEAFKRIRFFRSSSAPLSPTLHQQFLDKFHLPLLQAMGSTEGGNVFSNPQPPAKNKIGSPGLPWGFETRIVDREGNDVPRGEAGEVLLRGPAMMRGYYKDPEGTAAVLDSAGWLHTGDLARQDEDGYFFVVGRSKELIIKGGVNIAPRQIDEVLEAHPSVLEAAAVGVPDRYFGEDAVAFAVLRPGSEDEANLAAAERDLLAWCESRLGHFKSPSRIHFLKELPKGPSGKVQRLKLLDPEVLAMVALNSQPAEETQSANGSAYLVVPAAPDFSIIEEIIVTAWSEALRLDRVDRHTNFFALGGHSLLAIQCISKLRGKLPIALTINDFFECGTVFEQAELVRKRLRASASTPEASQADWERSLLDQFVPAPSEEPIPRRDDTIPCPLSPAQQRLWFLEQLNPGVPVYNEAEAVRLAGPLNVEALETAFNMIVTRHESLRSTISLFEGQPGAIIHKSWPLHVEKIDLSTLADAEREDEVNRLLVEKPRRIYDLGSEPGIRVCLLRLGEREHALILMMHHIICDWSSEGIIWRELSAIYRALINDQEAGGHEPTLPPLPVRHGDYAEWQQKRLAQEGFTADLDYWQKQLEGAPALLELPADRTRPTEMSYRGGRLRRKLDRGLTEKLRHTSQHEKVSLFTVFAAALDTLLYRYTGNDDILLGIPLADRDHQQLQSVIGFLLHTHVLRTRLTAGITFRELLMRVQKEALDLYAHRAAPFDQIVRRLGQERNSSHTPLFQVMLNWRDRDQQLSFIGLEGLQVESLMAHSETSKFDLLFFATDSGGEIWLELESSADLFDQDRMERMLGHYQSLLQAACDDPAQPIQAIELLPQAERSRVLYEWNHTAAEYSSGTCIHQLIEAQVARAPGAAALVFEGVGISYAELNTRANRLAHHLISLGVKPDTRVAVCAERSFEMVIALLAILKAGGAYVPLDPTYPGERLSYMLRDASPAALLVQPHLKHLFASPDSNPGASLPPLLDLTDEAVWAQMPASNPDPRLIGLTPRNLAYMIYTSGSTGQPKGVMLEHQGLTNRIEWMQSAYGLTPADAVLQKTPFGFDVSVWEFFWPLMTGARLVLARPEGHKDPAYLAETIKKNGITTAHFVPSMLQVFLEHAETPACTSLVRVIASGEALPATLARRFQAFLPHAALHNLYGPTEATVDVTAWSCPAGFSGSTVPIGKPIANTRMYVLDAQLHPAPIGVPGELYIAGVQVARGYLNRPELTAEKFLRDPFTTDSETRMYRTGDLGRWLPDGNIEYLGRNDFQVKLRGFRIELGEIESAIEAYPGVRQCVVTVHGKANSDGNAISDLDRRLVAYLVPANRNNAPTVEALRKQLEQRLPSYMVPSAFAVVDAMPLTPNGKVDIKKLMKMEIASARSEAPMAAPRDEIETSLVAIWERVLDVRPIGVRSNFFDLGGYSLMVIRLFDQINRTFRRSLPIATIFRFPTIEQLATLLRDGAIDTKYLVPIRPAGSKEPLFIVHSYLTYERFRQVVDPDRPLYGLHELEDDQDHIATLSERVSRYARQIRAVQPEGPYHLIGWCADSPLTIELARHLKRSGAAIGMLGLIDAPHPSYRAQMRLERKQAKLAARFSGWVNYHNERRKQFAGTGSVSYFVRAIQRTVTGIVRDILHRNWLRVFSMRMEVPAPGAAPNRSTVTVDHIEPYDGSITLFRPSGTNRVHSDTALGWSDIAFGGLEIAWTPGNHETMFTGDRVKRFGELLQEFMDREQESFAQPTESPAA